MPEERREIVREELPAELEAELPPVPNPEPEHPPVEPDPSLSGTEERSGTVQSPSLDASGVIRPCKVCGVSLEGEHPRRETCKPCQADKQKQRNVEFAAKEEALPEDERAGALGFVMPVLVIVEGENPDITGWVVSIYKLMKHHFGLSKNGISAVLDSFRVGAPLSVAVGLYAEMVEQLSGLEFADEATKIGLICAALEKCLGKDIAQKWKAF